MVCAQVMGNNTAVTVGGMSGHFELNVTLPLIAYALHECITCLSHGARVFAERCVAGIEANEKRCRELVDQSLMLVTALNPHIGYDRAAQAAKIAFTENKTLREVVLDKGWLDAESLDAALDPNKMTGAV